MSLENSIFVDETNPDESRLFRSIVEDPERDTILLYPSINAVKISTIENMSLAQRKKMQIVIIDATWTQAKKMYSGSELLKSLPAFTFDSVFQSNFRIKAQPKDYCLSTIESAYQVLLQLKDTPEEILRKLLVPFEKMVDRQINYQVTNNPNHIRKWENSTSRV